MAGQHGAIDTTTLRDDPRLYALFTPKKKNACFIADKTNANNVYFCDEITHVLIR